jgi:hypothetical protein
MQTQEVTETSHDTETSFPEDWNICSRNNFVSDICCHSLSKFLRLSHGYLYELVTTFLLRLFKEKSSFRIEEAANTTKNYGTIWYTLVTFLGTTLI